MLEEYMEILSSADLFSGMSWREIELFLQCSDAHVRRYGKNTTVLERGKITDMIYVVLQGELKAFYDSDTNHDNLTEKVTPAESFGYTYCMMRTPHLMGHITVQDSALLEIKAETLFKPCNSGCKAHSKVAGNLMMEFSKKVIIFSRKLHYMHMKSLREKLANFLLDSSEQGRRSIFRLKMNRTEMAEYLGVSRASMTRELSLMQQEGSILFDRNSFTIGNLEALRRDAGLHIE